MKIIFVIILNTIIFAQPVFDYAQDCDPILYLYVDEMPRLKYDGGLSQYIEDNLKWPYQIDASEEILISFVVTKQGTISNIKIEKGRIKIFIDEILNLIHSMPDWESGKINNKPVNTLLYLPIFFKLNSKIFNQ